MGMLILITGGARSGKSDFAAQLARTYGKNIAFLATCRPEDDEMIERIMHHKRKRPENWHTFEEPYEIFSTVKKIKGSFEVVIIDCLTLFVSNCFQKNHGEKHISKELNDVFKAVTESNLCVIMVTNELGSGIVPNNKLARDFRDTAGRINQLTAKNADEVYLMVCGMPLKLKG